MIEGNFRERDIKYDEVFFTIFFNCFLMVFSVCSGARLRLHLRSQHAAAVL